MAEPGFDPIVGAWSAAPTLEAALNQRSSRHTMRRRLSLRVQLLASAPAATSGSIVEVETEHRPSKRSRGLQMGLLNTKDGYGALTKVLHWFVVVLFAFQFFAATIMLRIGPAETALGLTQAAFYNWHKSIGLVALAVAVLRLLARKSGRLPDWAPSLSARERSFVHRAEQILYTAMFVMPVSGFLYVMAGGYGVKLFGVLELANPISESERLATAAKWTHIVSSYVLLLTLAGHIGLVLRHQLVLKNRLLHRMLPRGRIDKT